ncbi:MAG: ribonuclease III [Alphaproteobacteria bacterium]
MSVVEKKFMQLYAVLGHNFTRPEILEEALTHPSAALGVGPNQFNYERHEFLGDRVLGLAVSQLLMQRYRSEKVGSLARRMAALVREESLARVAQKILLGDYIILSKSEEDAGGRKNPAILADCCEAVISALYTDGGMPAAVRFIYAHWVPMMNEAIAPPKDPKTALQEYCQGRGLPLPTYTTIHAAGPAHDPMFSVAVYVRGLPRAQATGRSKRLAEQSAAAFLLKVLNLAHKNEA